MKNGDLLAQWQAYLLTEKRVAKNTYLSYISDMKQFFAYAKAHELDFKTVSNQALISYIHFLHSKQLKPSSMARKVIALKLFFEYVARKYAFQNNAEHLVAPKLESRLPKYLTENEIAALLSVCLEDTSPFGKRNNLIINLLYATGLRISELAHLSLADFRAEDGVLHVFGKGSKERVVPLPISTVDMIIEYVHNTLPTLLRQPVATGNEPLFPVLYGKLIKPISRQSLWMIIKKICTTAGIKKNVSPHQLRHSLATHLLKNGADLRSIQVLLGHQQLASVEIYTHVEKSHIRVMYDKKHPRS